MKLEGGETGWYHFRFSSAGIPVMGHIGLRPQSVHTMGGYKVQEMKNVFNDALAVQQPALAA